MLAQFQQEMWNRFTIPFVRLDSQGLQRVRSKIPSNKNPFHYFDKVIISIDTLKNDGRYRTFLEQTYWDAIVIDECHNVANADTQRNRLASLLSKTCNSLIMTSATPHNGNPETFANLMNMMDPTAIANPKDYTKDEIKGLFVRRFKKDIAEEAGDHFQDREMNILKVTTSDPEEKVLSTIEDLSFKGKTRGESLFKVTLLKAFLSSPHALIETLNNRIDNIQKDIDETKGDADAFRADIAILRNLCNLTEQISLAAFSKLLEFKQQLVNIGWTGKKKSPRIIVFSERIKTLNILKEYILNEFDLDGKAVDLFHAGLADTEQQRIVDDFGKGDAKVRMMLATDVASEGVNLHYHCHNMIHFDIPWSLIRMEQRNGRIDRYGQHEKPLIHYLMTASQNPKIKSDLRVLERLIEKENYVYKNIGDPAVIMGLYNADEEEKKVMKGIASGTKSEDIIPDTLADAGFLELLLAQHEDPIPPNLLADTPVLYKDEIKYAKEAFSEIKDDDSSIKYPDFHDTNPSFTWQAADDFKKRSEFIPREAIPEDWEFILSSDRDMIQKGIEDSRMKTKQGDSSWPSVQLFWEQHPVMEWLSDRVLAKFGRHDAPVIIIDKLAQNEYVYLFQGIMSNMKSQPLLVEWFGVVYKDNNKSDVMFLKETLEYVGFNREVTNPMSECQITSMIESNLGEAVNEASEWMIELNKERGQALQQRMKVDEIRFRNWHSKSLAELERMEEAEVNKNGTVRKHIREIIEHRKSDIEKLQKNRKKWLEETMKAVKAPYLKLACVFSGR